MSTIASSKSYENAVNTAPYPAPYAQTATPSDTVPLTKASRWIMITDLAAKAVKLRLGGVHVAAPAAIVGVSGDITMAANGALTSGTGGKFSSIKVNDIVKVSGFTNAVNNGTFKVTAATGTALTLVFPGSSLPLYTVAETPTGALATVQGPNVGTQDTVTFTALPGVMYPICADLVFATGTAATSVIAFY